MKLTVGMIAKNEERYLRQCLQALQPLLKALDSELILADTGSTDGTAEIAREFGAQVFEFQWVNDFAAARNAVMDRAQGEWFMTIDADEFLQDPAALIAFFNTGEYRQYGCASYIQRSFNAVDSAIYTDLAVIRLTELAGVRYVNPVHELFEPLRMPTMALPVVALHYGYLKSDSERVQRKTDLYLGIQLKALQKDPANCKHHYDLSNTYLFGGDYEKALWHATEGLKVAIARRSMLQYPLFYNKAAACCALGRYEKALSVTRDYFRARVKPICFDLDMLRMAAIAHFDSGDYRAAAVALQRFLTFHEEYRQGLHHGPENDYYLEAGANDGAKLAALQRLVCVRLALNEPAAALEALQLFRGQGADDGAMGTLLGQCLQVGRGMDYGLLLRLYDLMEAAGEATALALLRDWAGKQAAEPNSGSALWRLALQAVALTGWCSAESVRAYACAAYEAAQGAEWEGLPPQVRAGALLHRSAEADAEQADGLFRAAVETWPAIAGAAKLFTENQQQQRSRQQSGGQSELEYYAAIVKTNIATLLREGKKAKAEELIQALSELLPDDPELQALRESMN